METVNWNYAALTTFYQVKQIKFIVIFRFFLLSNWKHDGHHQYKLRVMSCKCRSDHNKFG